MPSKKMDEVVDGIYVEPTPVTLGEEVKIKYKGLLAGSGAGKVFLHAGYGVGEWEKVMDIPMRKTRDGGWSVTVQVEEPSSFNFCFRDDAQNWDNNFGKNWVYQIHTGEIVGH
ncbi:MAG TPA: carbohydrate-binding protein [Bacillota bacterium]